MAKKPTSGKAPATKKKTAKKRPGKPSDSTQTASSGGGGAAKPSSLLDTRVIYCGDCLEKLADLPDNCVDLIYIDPPFNSNRNYEVFRGETKEKHAHSGGEDRHASTQAYIDYMRPRCVDLIVRDRYRLSKWPEAVVWSRAPGRSNCSGEPRRVGLCMRAVRSRPNGARGCSHGWRSPQGGDRNLWTRFIITSRP